MGVGQLPARSGRGPAPGGGPVAFVFRERMFKLIDEVAARGRDHAVPPVPHLSLR